MGWIKRKIKQLPVVGLLASPFLSEYYCGYQVPMQYNRQQHSCRQQPMQYNRQQHAREGSCEFDLSRRVAVDRAASLCLMGSVEPTVIPR